MKNFSKKITKFAFPIIFVSIICNLCAAFYFFPQRPQIVQKVVDNISDLKEEFPLDVYLKAEDEVVFWMKSGFVVLVDGSNETFEVWNKDDQKVFEVDDSGNLSIRGKFYQGKNL